MKRMLVRVIRECHDCPYLKWNADIGCGNHDGTSRCDLASRDIEQDNKYPDIPKWCPLPKEKS